jgi:chromatin remodeling complex protein RSC6
MPSKSASSKSKVTKTAAAVVEPAAAAVKTAAAVVEPVAVKTAAAVVEPVAVKTAAVVEPAAVKTAAVVEPAAVKTAAVVEPAAVKTAAAKTGAKKTEQPTETQSSNVISQIQVLQEQISVLSTQLCALKKSLGTIQKEYNKESRQWEKLQNKKKKSGGGMKHQSGIAKPGFISPALCNFIGVTEGTEMARTEVIKFVNKYIKEKELQDETNKKVIVPDARLQTLLQSKTSDEITYFNLQTYMKPHYANPDKLTVSA